MQTIKPFLFSIGAVFVFFTAVEVGLRLSGFEPVIHFKTHSIPAWMEELDPVVLEKYKRFVAGLGFVNEDVYAYEPDLRYGYRLKPNLFLTVRNYSSALMIDKLPAWTIRSDAQGFRAPSQEPVATEPSARTVHVLGDSSSFGWGVNYEKTYSSVLVGKLNADSSSTRYKLRNLSLPGFSSFQGNLLWEDFATVKNGDWVILSFGWNDSTPSLETDSQKYKSRTSLLGSINWNLRHFSLYRWMRTWSLPESTIVKKKDIGVRVPTTQYRENIEALVAKIRQKGAKPLWVSVCNFNDHQSTAKKIVENMKTPFFDFPSALKPFIPTVPERFPKRFVTYFEAYGEGMKTNPMLLFLFPDRCHPNEIGHELMAEVLFEAIEGEAL